MPASEGYLTTPRGLRLFYQVIGNGPDIVVFPNGIYLLDDFQRLADGRTLIFYDVRNRGRSDAVTEPENRKAGILNDVDDLETLRGHFGAHQISLVGHSYVGLTVILYARQYGAYVNRIVQLSPIEPYPGKQYPPNLKWSDDVMRETFAKLGQLQRERGSEDPQEICQRFWSVLRAIYVFDPAYALKINWGRCELPNERGFMKYWSEDLFPSIQSLRITSEQVSTVSRPVLTIHGTKDRSAAYGGARDWARLLPNARLVTLENVAHAPWIEATNQVFDAIHTFLQGAWPASAEIVQSPPAA
jgi:pimeloyl-ACP methyl ester carboxylesterase